MTKRAQRRARARALAAPTVTKESIPPRLWRELSAALAAPRVRAQTVVPFAMPEFPPGAAPSVGWRRTTPCRPRRMGNLNPVRAADRPSH